MRIAVTGSSGRLGRALMTALADAPFTGLAGPIGWTRRDFDLDEPETAVAAIGRDRPEVVLHAAAWTDVDGCARDPATADRRNAQATAVLADACVGAGLDLVVVSTNEIFDGARTDGRGYGLADPPGPINAYGASKLAGEEAARSAFRAGADPGQLAIVRTAWLFGPGAPDFPTKILLAADRARAAGAPLRVVADEWGTPTYVVDLADAIVELLGSGAFAGTHHIVNGGSARRSDWARAIVGRAGLDVEIEDVPGSTWSRGSTPPRWGVLEPTELPSGEPLRAWQEAMADYAPILLRARAADLVRAGVGRATAP
ncbi:MAG: NAD(P)-dependent oxidoreductase [Chloroflexi bacterium]|nr:NAD(P)-dependent oxidoreductase [Chloroflexota bacterium]